jgi:hypothetical protein
VFARKTLWAIVAGVAAAGGGAARGDEALPETPVAVRRVSMTLAAEGQLFGPVTGAGEPSRQPIAMQGTFEFHEEVRPPAAAAVALRRYARADATIEADDAEQSLTLAADARTVSVARLGTTPLPYLADAYLSRDEIELLETPFDSILLEDMLPGRPIAADDHWSLPGDLAAGLLAIDTVEAGVIEARVVDIIDGMARITLAGAVDGAVDGVPTHVVVEGTFSIGAEPDEDGFVVSGDVARLDATIKENRQASHVAAGFEIEATIAITREPAAEAPTDDADAEEAPARVVRRRGPGKPGSVWYRDAEGRYDLVHDSGWRVVEEDAGGVVLRLLDLGALVAQCSITALPRSEDAAPPTVAEVKKHVEQSLSGQFRRFDGTNETLREDDGVRVIRVASEGSAEGLPFRWVHYVLTDGEGRRVNVAFMYEASLEQRFADADARLVAGLRSLAEPHREARLPRKTEMP